jgi:methyltransferase (TIGR00027 family)
VEKPERTTLHKLSEHDKSKQIRDTADVVAVIRYHEGKKEKPLVNDPFAHLFASSQGEEILESALKRWPFFSDYLVVRAKFFDDTLRNFCEKEDIKQIVMLGAGNDMRAVRLPFLKRKKIFEVDYPDRIAYKKDILKKALEKLPKNTIYVGANIKHDNLIKLLSSTGFMIHKKAVFIMEGLIYYLGSAGVDHLFENLSHLPTLGSIFLLDHISKDMSQKSRDPEKRIKHPYPEDPLRYLTHKGFKIIENVFLGNLTEKYCGKRYQERWWAITCEL